MPAQELPRKTGSSAIRHNQLPAITPTGGGGGPTPTIEWGPDYGNGSDGGSVGTAATIFLEGFGWLHAVGVDSAIDINRMELGGGMGVAAIVELQFGQQFDALDVRAAIDLLEAALNGNVDVQANMDGRMSLDQFQLGINSAIDIDSLAGNGNLDVQSAIDLNRGELSGGVDVNTTIRHSAATQYDQLVVEAVIDLDSGALNGNLDVQMGIDGMLDLDSFSNNVQSDIALTRGELRGGIAADQAIFLDRYELIDYLNWANFNITTTSWTNPNNAIDKDIATFAHAIATATGIGGITNATILPDLVTSYIDQPVIFISFAIDSVVWEYRWQTLSAGTQVTAGTVNVNVRYSTDDGGAYTIAENVTAAVSDPGEMTVDLTAIANTWTKINQFRRRVDGTITSGTGLGKTQTMRWFYSRLRIQAHWDL